MHLRVTSIASGSSGNSFLIEADDVKVLIDAGITAKRLAGELQMLRVDPSDIDVVFLSHEHSDHIGSVGAFCRRNGVPVVGNEGTLARVILNKVETSVLRTGSALKLGCLSVTSFPLPHDAAETVGYFLEYDQWRICIATDLGYVPDSIKPFVRGSDLVILESNHDVDQVIYGPYPARLKERILGRAGHLANLQAAECISECASGHPQWFWLAHLSEVNNSPRCALKTVKKHLQQEGIDGVHVDVALRDRRSLVWDAAEAGIQQKLL